MKFILGKKLGNTQTFLESGEVISVTKIQAGPCQVTQVKSKDSDGYQAVQLGFGTAKSLTKALMGHLKDLPQFKYLKEFRLEEGQNLVKGQTIDASSFKSGELVNVTGVTKGKGFQGVVRRHGFHGQKATHGHKDQERMPGSIGATDPQHVFKGTRMGGHMGNEQMTIKNLEIAEIDEANNLIYLKGAVPGAINGLVWLQAPGDIKKVETKKEEPVVLESAEPVQSTVEIESVQPESNNQEQSNN